MAAGHRDPVLETHQLGQHLGAGDRRDAPLPGLVDLDVVGRDGRRVHDHVGGVDVRGIVPDVDLGPELLEALHRFVASLIGARHPVAQIDQDLGDARHAAAADAHEVDVPVALKHWRAGTR